MSAVLGRRRLGVGGVRDILDCSDDGGGVASSRPFSFRLVGVMVGVEEYDRPKLGMGTGSDVGSCSALFSSPSSSLTFPDGASSPVTPRLEMVFGCAEKLDCRFE